MIRTILCKCNKAEIRVDDDSDHSISGINGLVHADNITAYNGKVTCLICGGDISWKP